eukprot:CAMPEP_0118645186 /NCGR_PEP_ID=MMETSP0785-20121206/7362_1 /TAXON_ID=91992 /ORGANISM="Bolidomonas pacifica, Strain CCMP 1866" /LENGTH=212 /DNA_ID=CAMNT_0006537043 /DNA_START=166 /DNA_END=802 /DNA_ORIENTATION=+
MRRQSAYGLLCLLLLALTSTTLLRITILSLSTLLLFFISIKTDKVGRPEREEEERVRKEEGIVKEVRRRVSSKNLQGIAGLVGGGGSKEDAKDNNKPSLSADVSRSPNLSLLSTTTPSNPQFQPPPLLSPTTVQALLLNNQHKYEERKVDEGNLKKEEEDIIKDLMSYVKKPAQAFGIDGLEFVSVTSRSPPVPSSAPSHHSNVPPPLNSPT